jgi:galactokinase
LIDLESLRHSFQRLYAAEPRIFRAPGRVNLIGEHTDYNDGFVLPMAIDRTTCVAGRARTDRTVRVHSINFNESAAFDLDSAGAGRCGLWLDYVEGVARELEARRQVTLRGADLMVYSDVPAGAGLSSSAALEVSCGLALLSLSDVEINLRELALSAQAAEHNWVGIKSGIMDQMISVLGRKGHALLLDCRTLETREIPLDTTGDVFVVCDTRVKHSLAASAYNQRRAECEEGVRILRRVMPHIRALRDVSVEDFLRHESTLPESVRRRCRHVVTENERTLRAAAALSARRVKEMGRLMFESHQSLASDYEVSCRELDLMVEIASNVNGVHGARMTGGGFGGSTINLLSRDSLEEFREDVSREYQAATGIEPAVHVAEASDGAVEIGPD